MKLLEKKGDMNCVYLSRKFESLKEVEEVSALPQSMNMNLSKQRSIPFLSMRYLNLMNESQYQKLAVWTWHNLTDWKWKNQKLNPSKQDILQIRFFDRLIFKFSFFLHIPFEVFDKTSSNFKTSLSFFKERIRSMQDDNIPHFLFSLLHSSSLGIIRIVCFCILNLIVIEECCAINHGEGVVYSWRVGAFSLYLINDLCWKNI